MDSDDFFQKLDARLTSLTEQCELLTAKVNERDRESQELKQESAFLKSALTQVALHSYKRHIDFKWILIKHNQIRRQQETLTKLLESRLLHAQRENMALKALVEQNSERHSSQLRKLLVQRNEMREELAIVKAVDQRLSEINSFADNSKAECSKILEEFATEVEHAHQDRRIVELGYLEIETATAQTQNKLNALCNELIEFQKAHRPETEASMSDSSLSEDCCTCQSVPCICHRNALIDSAD